jgi:anthranilate phosphoribosyltransferase
VILRHLTSLENLDRAMADWALEEVMSGRATSAQIAALLMGLKVKGEVASEVIGFVEVMYRHAMPVNFPGRSVDCVGTGGDGANTINISTTAAIVAAAAGATVIKHGSKAASSQSGSADVLVALGVATELDGDGVVRCATEIGIGFCFAPTFHPAMKNVAQTRREMGVTTVFNIVGPLSNPARPRAQAIGVADPRWLPVVADVLATRMTDALVFRGDDGLDELSLSRSSTVYVVSNGEVVKQSLNPLDFGIAPAPKSALSGGDAIENAAATRAVLAGARGPHRDAILLNAAATLAAFDAPKKHHLSLNERMEEALVACVAAIDSGTAQALLSRWVDLSQSIQANP